MPMPCTHTETKAQSLELRGEASHLEQKLLHGVLGQADGHDGALLPLAVLGPREVVGDAGERPFAALGRPAVDGLAPAEVDALEPGVADVRHDVRPGQREQRLPREHHQVRHRQQVVVGHRRLGLLHQVERVPEVPAAELPGGGGRDGVGEGVPVESLGERDLGPPARVHDE